MPDPSHTSSSPTPKEECQEQVKGIDFPRAYDALIKGYVQVQVSRKSKDTIRQTEDRGEQR